MVNVLKIGVLGCAQIAMRSVIPAINKIEGLQLIGVASRTADKAKMFAERFGCEGFVGYQTIIDREDIDVLYIPLPTGLHEEWIGKALSAGKHLLVEKSLAIDYSSAIRMVNRAREQGLLLMENFMFLYHGQHRYVQSLINRGEIGELRCFRSSFGFPPLASDNFRYNKQLGGGALLDAAAYTVRASQFFLGSSLMAKAATLHYVNDGVDIYGGAYLENEVGQFAEVAFGFDNFYQCQYELWGSLGKITAQRAFTPGPEFKPKVVLEKQGKIDTIELPAEDHFVGLLNVFVRCVRRKDMEDKYNEVLMQSRLLHEIRELSR